MAGKKTVIISLILVALAFAGLIAARILLDKIPQNPPGTVGNTAGNLNNGGYFCESEGKVYFANNYDSGAFYCMNADETDIQKINTAQIQYINKGGNYLYYYQKDSEGASSLGFVVHMSGVYRCKTNGDKVLCLDKTDSGTVSLIGNTVFYEKVVKGADTRRLYRIGIDKKNGRECTEYLVNPASGVGGGFYYNGTVSDHFLYFYNADTESSNLIEEYDMWFPTLCDNYIYFMDTRNDYQLCRYSLSSGQMDVLTTDRVECFNVYGNYIYYQRNDADQPALMRMYTDGSNPEVVAAGNYCDINITSQYVYFHAFGAPEPIFHTPTGGPISVSRFEAAREAAIKEMSTGQ